MRRLLHRENVMPTPLGCFAAAKKVPCTDTLKRQAFHSQPTPPDIFRDCQIQACVVVTNLFGSAAAANSAMGMIMHMTESSASSATRMQ